MRTVYKEIITSKTGFQIPVLTNGKTIESRYNPETDVMRKIESIKTDDNFYLIIGLGSGLLVSKLLELNKKATFLIVENSNDDFNFLSALPEAKKIIELAKFNGNSAYIKLCIKDDLEKTLPSFYIPALHGNMNIIEQTNYLSADENFQTEIKQKINSALKTIMADFSVQAHFGKIWQRNIIKNLMQYKTCKEITFQTNKTAVILAAGPSLDFYLENIKPKRNDYFIIATDTAFSSAQKNGIICDAVVSIDGQQVSGNHFLHNISGDTLFIFDLCANPSAVKKSLKYSDKIIFANTEHPFSNYVSTRNSASFINLFAGTGTVTITAVDFAVKAGFSKIEIAGADFSYRNGKPYAKGTYLDNLYNKNSNRLSPSEMTFSKLMYRTELIKKNENTFTTTVLESYKKSLEDYLSASNLKYKNENNIYYILNDVNKKKLFGENSSDKSAEYFSFTNFYKSILDDYKSLDLSKINYSVPNAIPQIIVLVLPYIAFLRLSNPNMTMQEMVKLAYTNMMRYNYIYEKK